MKNSKISKLVSWLLKQIDKKQIQIDLSIDQEIKDGACFERLILPIQELNDIFIIQFFNKHNKHGMVSGLGSDFNQEQAYLKAIVEYFERLAFFNNEQQFNLKSSNGIASHKVKVLAKNSAIDELIERDAFLIHWYSNSPFVQLELNVQQIRMNNTLIKKNLELKIGKTYLGLRETTACFLIDHSTGGFALGLSSGRGSKDSEKAVLEALINYFFGNLGQSREEQLQNISNSTFSTLTNHRAYWLYKESMPTWVFDKSGQLSHLNQIRNHRDFECSLIEKSPFFTYLCKNDNLLSLNVGLISERNIALLTKMGLKVISGSTEIHPIP